MVIYVRAQTQYYLDIVKSEIFQSCTAYCLEIPKKFSPDFAANICKTFAELRWLEMRLCSVVEVMWWMRPGTPGDKTLSNYNVRHSELP